MTACVFYRQQFQIQFFFQVLLNAMPNKIFIILFY